MCIHAYQYACPLCCYSLYMLMYTTPFFILFVPALSFRLLFDLHELFNDTTLMPKMLQRKRKFLPFRITTLSDTSWY